MRTALSSWLTKVNPQLCRGQKNSFQRGVKQTEKKLPIMAEVVCRPHNYDNEEVSLVKEVQARPSEMLDDILIQSILPNEFIKHYTECLMPYISQ